MTRRYSIRSLLALICLGACALVISACGEGETNHVTEAETLELGDVAYRVQITRFLNPQDVEDAEYLDGLPDSLPEGKAYLGVFLKIDNEGSGDFTVPSKEDFTVKDTTDQQFSPTPQNTPFSLVLGDTIPSEGELPLPDSAAGAGPIEGALLLFVVDTSIAENRPVELEIDSDGNKGSIELDI
jgi:hypothetical protein